MLRLILFINVISVLFVATQCIIVGSKVIATKGEVWPQPTQQLKGETIFKLSPSNLFFKESGKKCSLLTGALSRYKNVLKSMYDLASKHSTRSQCNATVDAEMITELQINLNAPCEKYPHLEMDEKYSLNVSAVSTLNSDSIWGILRGLETFVQLFYISEGYTDVLINSTQITDQPKYPHRGLLIGTARHYLSVPTILKILDGMEMDKLNVLHWHIVGDESFPYESQVLPQLSKAAYFPTMVYNEQDINRIVKYARNRGIRVIPEFNMPGSTESWGVAFPDILTTCYMNHGYFRLALLDPTKNDTYKVISDLLHEVRQRFPDEYINIGGNADLNLKCWESIPRIKDYMREHGISFMGLLYFHFMEKVFPLLGNSKPIVYQEAFESGLSLPNGTIVHYWKKKSSMKSTINSILEAGHKVLISSDSYATRFDLTEYPVGDFANSFLQDPRSEVDKHNETGIVGAVAFMWGEVVDDNTVISRIWPRASAVAQRLWNGEHWQAPSEEEARHTDRVINMRAKRIEEHTCRMKRRGVHGKPPNGAGYCVTE